MNHYRSFILNILLSDASFLRYNDYYDKMLDAFFEFGFFFVFYFLL